MLTTTDAVTALKTKLDSNDAANAEVAIEVETASAPTTTTDTLTIVKKDSTGVTIVTPAAKIAANADDPYVDTNDNESGYSAYLTIPATTSQEANAETGYITLSAKKGDTITIVAYAEGTAPVVTLTKVDDSTVPEQPAPSDDITTFANEKTHIIRLFAKDSDFPTGTDSVTYKISSEDTLNIARIYRGNEVTLSGSITFPENYEVKTTGDDALKITFTSTQTVAVDDEVETQADPAPVDEAEAEITPDGTTYKYSVDLKNGLEYTVSSNDSGCEVTVGSGTDADDKVTAIKDDETTNITFKAKSATKLAAPATVTASDESSASAVAIKVIWDAVTDADSYSVEIKENGASTAAVTKTYLDASAAETVALDDESLTPANGKFTATITDSGLTRGKSYTVSVVAKDSTSAKADSDAKTATVSIAPASNPPTTDVKTIDISSGLVAKDENGAIKYYGDSELLKLSVLIDMPKSDMSGASVTIDGVEYTNAIQQPNDNPSPSGGSIPTAGAAFKIEAVKNVSITFPTWGAGSSKTYYFLEETTSGAKEIQKGTLPNDITLTFEMEAGKTYYYYVSGSKVKVYGISYQETVEKDWSQVTPPTLGTPTPSSDGSAINVPVTAVVGSQGGDKVSVKMYKGTEDDTDAVTLTSTNIGTSHTLSFKPTTSGTYKFKAYLSRESEAGDGKPSNEVTYSFVIPLVAPTITSIENKGKVTGSDPESGSVEIVWDAVPEATGYQVSVKQGDTDIAIDGTNIVKTLDADTTTVTISQNLAINAMYTFTVAALRDTESKSTSRVLGITATSGGKYIEEKQYTLAVGSDLKEFANGAKAGESESAGTDNYFTMHYGDQSSVELSKNGDFSDGRLTGRLVFRNVLEDFTTESDCIEFSTSAFARVKIWWRAGDADRQMRILDSDGEEAAITNEPSIKDGSYISYLYLKEGGTYYLGGSPLGNYIFKVEVYNGYDMPAKIDWEDMAAPVIKKAEFKKGSNSVVQVTVTANVGEAGADKVTVSMYDKDDETKVYTRMSSSFINEHTLEITPGASGEYKFAATISRETGETLEGPAYPAADDEYFPFTLPLAVPSIKGVTNKGAVGADKRYGSAELSWNSVPEATSYLVKAVDKEAAAGADPAYEEEIPAPAKFVTIDEGLEINHTYIFSVAAKRTGTGANGEAEITAYSETRELEIKDENKRSWLFSAYGDSTNTRENGYTDADHVGKENKTILEGSGDVRVWSEGGAGKIVPASVDGLAFYYTEVDPTSKNFTLSAIAHVNSWDISNGQDGFGLMAADRVGDHGNSGKWWNNSYQALASKIEYRWNPNLNAADYSSNTDYTKYSMKLGIGTTEKRGVTKENLPLLNNTDTVVSATKRYFKSTTKTLETYCGRNELASGTWNVIGNYTTGNTPEGTVSELVTDLLFSIELNNTGYYLSYTPITVEKNDDGSIKRDENGKVVYKATGDKVTNKHYDRNALSKIEEESVYVGFFASRHADVTFMNIELDDSIAYDPNGEVEQQPIEKIDPAYGFTSGTTANDANYDLLFAANWQGHVTVKDSAGNVIVGYDTAPKAEDESYEDYIIRSGRVLDETDPETGEYLMIYEPIKVPVELGFGTTTFTYTFVPDGIEDYNPDPNSEYNAETNSSVPKGFIMLSDYSSQSGTIAVTYKTYGESGKALYVSPTGTALGNGTQRNPLDIYTAVKYVQAGQTIYLMDGTYNLTKTVTIDRGINGTADNRIYMIPADSSTRPIFNFNKQCEGIVVAGNYWYLKGFDVTGSANAKDGMRISGSHNVIEQVNAYMNGNTGIQISRYTGSDTWDYWPSYNLVLNCTSYLNSDQGFEDADGFTAKLTIADGNVFDGCIAAYNADDGWDLFAKVESGNIGTVTIKNCIAYKNGYVLVKDTDGDGKISDNEARATDRVFSLTEGLEAEAGNGNGFKLGGSNLPDKAGANGITGWDAGHTVENCLAFYNRAKGIDSNSCPNIKAKNSISYNNGGANVAFYGTASNTDFASDGLISYRTASSEIAKMSDIHDNIQPLGRQLKNNGATGMSAFYNDKSYYWYPGKDKDGNSVSPAGSFQIDAAATAAKVKSEKLTDARPDKDNVVWKNSTGDTQVADNWFVKVGEAEFKLFDQGFKENPSSVRKADATLTTNGFLELNKANALVGDSLGGADHTEQGNLPEIPDSVTETDGSISKGDAADETSSGVAPEDMDKFIELNGTIKDSEDIIGLWFNVVEEVSYTGKAVKPLVHVYNGTTLLTKKDYSITYRNNVNAYVADTTADDYDASYAELKTKKKVPTIIVKGRGNYVGMVEATFDIHPVNVGNDSILNRVNANDLTLVSTGKALNVKPVVTFGTRKLSNAKNKDYEIKGIYQITDTPAGGDTELASEGDTASGDNTGTNRTKVTSVTAKGVYEIDITGHGNFTGERTIGLRVYDKGSIDNDHLVSKFKVDKIADQYREVVSISNYTGAITAAVPKTPTLTVKNSKGQVNAVDTVNGTEKVNYVVTYKNNVEIGTATAIITGVGDYYGTKEVKFRIMAPAINLMERQKELTVVDTSKAVNETTHMYPEFTNKTNEYPFVGKAIEPPIAVQLKNGTLLTKDVDYVLSFRNNNRAGTASVVIRGKGNYSGSITKTFKIKVFDLADAKNRQYIGGTFKFASETKTEGDGENVTTSVVYTDKYAATLSVAAEKGANRPNVTLTINGVTMKLGRDYTVTYKNNTYAAQLKGKQPQVIITGRGALKGKLTKDFTITKKNLNQVTVTAQDVKISSKKGDAVSGNISARIVLQDLNGRRLSPGADYDRNITYILLDDYGNESGTSTTKGSIENNKRITINKSTNVLTVRAIIKASTAANTSYTGQTTVDFQVGYAKQALSSARFEINYNNGRFKYFNYTGENIVITDNLKVYFDKNNPLVVNEDYEILPATYKNNNKKGTASVVIRGKGNYSGTKVITFRIGAQNITDSGWWSAK